MARFIMLPVALAAVLLAVGCKNPPRFETDNPPTTRAPATEWGPKRTPTEGSYRDFSESDPTVVEPDIGDAVPPGKYLWEDGYYETTEEIPWPHPTSATIAPPLASLSATPSSAGIQSVARWCW